MHNFREWVLKENFCEDILDKIAIFLASENTAYFLQEAINQESESTISENFSEMTKKLRDSIIWIRWHSMLDRQKKSLLLKKLLSQYRKVKKFDWNKATLILKEMGYIDLDKLNNSNIGDETRERLLLKALQNASNENGNQLPVDVTEEDVEKNIIKARETFFTVLKKIFDNQYARIAGDPAPNEKRNYRFFSDKDDLANKFMLRMYSHISERPKLKNKIAPWKSFRSAGPEFGHLGKIEFETDNLLDELLITLKSWLGKELSKERLERRMVNSPRSGLKDDIANRDKKRSIINLDLIKAQKTKSHKPLAFYLKYIDANLKNKTLKPRTPEDAFRMEIMQHISDLKSRYPDLLSFDRNKIVQTLSNYRNIFSKKQISGPVFIGNANQTEKTINDEEEIIKKTDRGSKIASGLASYSQNPEIQVQNAEMDSLTQNTALNRLHLAMNQLASFNAKWALALCVKFGLNCSNGRVDSVDNFSNAIIRMTKSGKSLRSNRTDCPNQLSSIGLSIDAVSEQISKILREKQSIGTIYNWVNSGLKFICDKMKAA
jgi:hypothetical protein